MTGHPPEQAPDAPREEEEAQSASLTAPAPAPVAAPVTAPQPPAKPAGLIRRNWDKTKHVTGNIWKFTKELFNDHGFWVDALAVKGGVTAVVAAGLVMASYLVALPFLVGAVGFALCGGLAAVGIFGIVAGGAKAWEGAKDVWARAMGRTPKQHVYKEKKDILQRIAETDFCKKITNHRWAKKIAGTHAWKTVQKFTRKTEDNVLGGVAVGGAALSIVVGALALPFIAVGTIVTFAAVMTASTIIGGFSSLYFSITGIRHRSKEKAAAKAAAAAAKRSHPLGLNFPLEPHGQPIDFPGVAAPFSDVAAKPAPEQAPEVAVPAIKPLTPSTPPSAP
ncbi:MAG: hypothetical protein ACAH80_04040 [Alphaproteobacteria bacterium]